MKLGYLMQEGVPDMRRKPLSGPANHVVSVIRELQALGHQICLLARFGNSLFYSEDLEDYRPVTVGIMDQGLLRWLERGLRRVQYELKLPYLALFESARFALACRQILADCDLFYERLGWMGYGGGLASKLLNVPLILEVNGDHLSEFEKLGIAPMGAQWWFSSRLMRSAAQRATFAVATGEGWRQIYIERWGVSPEKVGVIENGSSFVDLLHREDLRSFNILIGDHKTLNLIYLGAFEPWNGISILIRAFSKAINDGLDLHLYLVGDGSETQALKHLVKDLDLESRVTFPGHLTVSEAVGYLVKADIGVSPYCGRVEYSGLKLLDYKAAGLATIASGKNGQPAIIKHGRTGLIVPPCDVKALYEAILYLANNSDIRCEMGRQARIEAESQHAWRHTARHLEQIFLKVLGEKNVPIRNN